MDEVVSMFDPEKPPELTVRRWLGTREPITLSGLKGKVVVLEAFQMLCPGCVSHGLPQASRIRERFGADDVAVLGLHTVFEHHAVMTEAALEAFLHEYRLPFPVGIDEPDGDSIPVTMRAYQMRGTPTLLIFDRVGRLRRHYFGAPDDMVVAGEIAAMALESDARETERGLSRVLIMPGARPRHGHQHGPGDSCSGDACG